MNLYGFDYTSLDLGLIDPHFSDYLSTSHEMIADRRNREREVQNLLKLSNSLLINSRTVSTSSDPPKHRHDGTSPLPLGMDWSPPPRTWDGPNTVWPHDFHTGWSYCVTIPSWSFLSESEGSEPGVFYRVQVGLQSPEGVTTTNEVLRRFSDFLKLSSDLKQYYRQKKFPPPPPKGIFKIKSETALEERRVTLEDWMTKVLSDIDISRSFSVACFLELEAVARLSFRESSYEVPDVNVSRNNSSSSDPVASQPDATSAFASNRGSATEASENGSELPVKDDNSEIGKGIPVYLDDAVSSGEVTHGALSENNNPALSKESSEAFPMTKKQNQFLTATEQQLAMSKTDIEDLVARLNQERAARQYLSMKVNDLETELESTEKMAKENLEQAISMEEERITQIQWDMEELRRKCIEMELKLKAEQDEDSHDKVTEVSNVRENETEEFESVREQLRNLQKSHEEAELKSKSEVKLLVKEIKSLRSSQSELRQELDKMAEERSELETRLQKELEERECINAVNTKLLHKCETLWARLGEFDVSSMIDQENKLKRDALSSSDVRERLAAAENEIGHLLEEAQDVATSVLSPNNEGSADTVTTDHELRKMLIELLIDNAILKKQANRVIQCAFSMTNASSNSQQIAIEDAA